MNLEAYKEQLIDRVDEVAWNKEQTRQSAIRDHQNNLKKKSMKLRAEVHVLSSMEDLKFDQITMKFDPDRLVLRISAKGKEEGYSLFGRFMPFI